MDIKNCVICNEKVGIVGFKLKDGHKICERCAHRAEYAYYDLIGYEMDFDNSFLDAFYKNRRNIDTDEARKICENPKLLSKYMPDKYQYGRHIYEIANVVFDDDNKTLTFGNTLDLLLDFFRESGPRRCSYSGIMKYEYYENEDVVATGGSGIGRAIVGGLLFGGSGAVVGATTKKRSSTSKVTDMYILVTFRSMDGSEIYSQKIDFNESGESLKKGSGKYLRYISTAETVLEKLDEVYFNEHPKEATTSESHIEEKYISPADEIRKYNELFKDGIITEEEFNQKKKELLGL